jgi:ribosomal protein L11 methylase PrmA
MPYRVDLPLASPDTLDRLVTLGALDIATTDNGLAALLPDSVSVAEVKTALGTERVHIREARGRDEGSVWILEPRAVTIAGLHIVPANDQASAEALQLVDSDAFGTGLHPTTQLCLEALARELEIQPVDSMLDVGTGSGILALAGLRLGIDRAMAIDIDVHAALTTRQNGIVNGLASRLAVACAGPENVIGTWPLVVANILASPLIELAPVLARRTASRGRLVLGGLRDSLAEDVGSAYRRLGMRQLGETTQDGWSTLVLSASW